MQIRERPFHVNQAMLRCLQQNTQSTGDGQPLFTRDADAEFFIHEQQVGVLSCGQLNSLALSRIKSRQSCVGRLVNLLDQEPWRYTGQPCAYGCDRARMTELFNDSRGNKHAFVQRWQDVVAMNLNEVV